MATEALTDAAKRPAEAVQPDGFLDVLGRQGLSAAGDAVDFQKPEHRSLAQAVSPGELGGGHAALVVGKQVSDADWTESLLGPLPWSAATNRP